LAKAVNQALIESRYHARAAAVEKMLPVARARTGSSASDGGGAG
jgi:hypothetical protein